MNPFSLNWIRSTKARKQRKYRTNAPNHIKRTFLGAKLSKDLTAKHKRKNISVRTGDTVKVLRGQFKGKEGKVTKVNVELTRIYVEGVITQKKDGNMIPQPIHPSNIMTTELTMTDKRRITNEKSS